MYTVKQLSFMVSVLLLFTTACNSTLTKEGYIHNYEAWVTTLKQEYQDYKKADWSRAEATFRRYSETEYSRFKDDLSPEERQRIDRITGEYYGVLAKYKSGQVKDELNSFINKAKGMFEELKRQ